MSITHLTCDNDRYESLFIQLKGLHFVKAINAIIAISLEKSEQAPERYRG